MGASDREQIEDTLVRALLGIDTNTASLFTSAWSSKPDISMEIMGNTMTGIDAIMSGVFNTVGPLTTQHHTTGIRVHVDDGANTALLTANALNQHIPPDEPMGTNMFLLAASTYEIQFVKEDGDWKMSNWKLAIVWTRGDYQFPH